MTGKGKHKSDTTKSDRSLDPEIDDETKSKPSRSRKKAGSDEEDGKENTASDSDTADDVSASKDDFGSAKKDSTADVPKGASTVTEEPEVTESSLPETPEETIDNIAKQSKKAKSPVNVIKDPSEKVIRRGKVIVDEKKLNLPDPDDVSAIPSKSLLAPRAIRSGSEEDWITVRHLVTDRKLYGTRVYAFTKDEIGKLPREVAYHFKSAGKVTF